MVDQHEEATIGTTDVGFTFAGGETDAASTNIWIPHSEFPQGVSVSVMSIESTPFLIGLDVIREYGLVIDYHHNRVYSHETVSSLCNSSDKTSCFGQRRLALRKYTARNHRLLAQDVVCFRAQEPQDQVRRHACGLESVSHQQYDEAVSNCLGREGRDRSYSCKDRQGSWQHTRKTLLADLSQKKEHVQ